MDKCQFCGSERASKDENGWQYFDCGTSYVEDDDDLIDKSTLCRELQITQLKEAVKEAIVLAVAHRDEQLFPKMGYNWLGKYRELAE